MKKTITIGCLCLLLAACGGADKKAQAYLQKAQTAYEAGNYEEAKALIDSIKSKFPKAYDTRREGQRLMQQTVLKEQEQNLAFLDSLLAEKRQQLQEVSSRYVLEKDTAYQQLGNYIHPSQVLEKCLHRTYLSFAVNERGEMRMTSVFCGKNNIHHYAVKVIAPDGTYAETPAAKECYETNVLGEQIEKADFKLGDDGGVMDFIYRNSNLNLKLELTGERKFTTSILPSDRQALVAVYDLAHLLCLITQMEEEREQSVVKIRFVKKKMEENTSEAND